MKTIYYTASSLDGFIATPDHSLEWLLQFDADSSSYPEFIQDVGAVAMGSSTYEWLLRELAGEAWPYSQPAWVFTTRELPTVAGADVRFVRGDVRPVHAQMAAAAVDKHIWVVGGGDLAGQFYDAGLLDEIIVTFGSVTLGSGQPLLPRSITSPPLRLVSAKAYGEAFAELRYQVQRPPAPA